MFLCHFGVNESIVTTTGISEEILKMKLNCLLLKYNSKCYTKIILSFFFFFFSKEETSGAIESGKYLLSQRSSMDLWKQYVNLRLCLAI